MRWLCRAYCPLLFVGVLFAASPLRAQDGTNVLLVVNDASPESQQIAARYAAARRIPTDNIVRLKTDLSDDLERARFDIEIERPIAEWIVRRAAQDRILYIVLTKGIPLRIRGSGGLTGTVASVDSELTLLYRKLLGISLPPNGRLPNPYFQGERPISQAKTFSHTGHDIYLVTRLDGFSVADVFRLIDRGAAPVRQGVVVLQQKAQLFGDRSGDAWLAAAAGRLRSSGFSDRVVLESPNQVIADQKPVLGYYSWGSNDPAIARRRFGLGFAPGALAAMFVSTDGRTFKEPPPNWNVGNWQDPKTFFAGSPQSLIGDLIREGATGAAGHVAEPYLDGAIRPHVLFPAYFGGFNLAESFYLAMPFLSWQTVVIGDPLCGPFRQQQVSAEETVPALDPETELPRFFSTRRLAVLSGFGLTEEIAALMLKADALLIRGDLSGLRAALERVIRIEPAMNAAHFVLATLYAQAGEFDRAIERYRSILGNTADDVRAANNLAYELAVRKNELEEALSLAQRAYELAKDRQITADLGYALVARRGTPSSALPFTQQVMSLGSHAQIADTLGWVHFLLGHQDEADRYLTEAVAGEPTSAEIQYHVAAVRAAAGRVEEARRALQTAVQLDTTLAERDDVKRLRARLTLQ
jgi:uncharacterized protein (TIGR03790 family)